jgi:hypothetical protein
MPHLRAIKPRPINVLGAFAQAASQNSSDTSAADLTMKGLGILAGGGGVSAADSAAAIQSYMSASGGNGVLYQYVTTATSKENVTTKDTLTHYLTNGGGRALRNEDQHARWHE